MDLCDIEQTVSLEHSLYGLGAGVERTTDDDNVLHCQKPWVKIKTTMRSVQLESQSAGKQLPA